MVHHSPGASTGPRADRWTPLLCVVAVAAVGALVGACSSGPPDATTPATGPSRASPAVAPEAVVLLVAYAAGDTPDVAWSEGVTLSVAGERVGRFGPTEADRRRTWRGCPPDQPTYEGRDCPVSVLRTIADSVRQDEGVTYETEPPRVVGCTDYRRPPAGDTVWIRPDAEHRDCFTDFAVAVTLDASGSIEAVDLALSGP